MNIEFRFADLQAFMWMEGHGPYVWACYGLTLVAILFLVFEPQWQKRRFIQRQKALAKRKAQTNAPVSSEV